MKRRLTDRFLKTVSRPRVERESYQDTVGPGLVLRVPEMSWSVRYTPKGGGQKRATYGTYPAISLAEARSRARDISAATARGIDLPAEEKRAREESRKAAERPGTVEDLLDEYVERHC